MQASIYTKGEYVEIKHHPLIQPMVTEELPREIRNISRDKQNMETELIKTYRMQQKQF